MEKVFLDKTNSIWIFLNKKNYLYEDQEDILKALEKCIVKWNLTDDDDKPLKITKENIEKLRLSDVMMLFEKIRPQVETLTLEEEKSLILAISAQKQGIDIDIKIPQDYVMFLYRQKMNISYDELMRTPIEAIYKDLEFIRIESQVK